VPGSTQTGGVCSKCGQAAVACRYNFFDRGDLQIHAWEHKCANCGHRDTQAFRSDDPDAAETMPRGDVCPFCGRRHKDA
jgi:hypothetical protein